jgi:hypothetical protein
MNQTDKGPSILLANIGSEGTAALLSTYNDIEMFLAPLVINNHAYEIHCRNRVNETFTILDSVMRLYPSINPMIPNIASIGRPNS